MKVRTLLITALVVGWRTGRRRHRHPRTKPRLAATRSRLHLDLERRTKHVVRIGDTINYTVDMPTTSAPHACDVTDVNISCSSRARTARRARRSRRT